jgi:hypothetical protein
MKTLCLATLLLVGYSSLAQIKSFDDLRGIDSYEEFQRVMIEKKYCQIRTLEEEEEDWGVVFGADFVFDEYDETIDPTYEANYVFEDYRIINDDFDNAKTKDIWSFSEINRSKIIRNEGGKYTLGEPYTYDDMLFYRILNEIKNECEIYKTLKKEPSWYEFSDVETLDCYTCKNASFQGKIAVQFWEGHKAQIILVQFD